MLVCRSSAALSASGSPARRASVMPRSASSALTASSRAPSNPAAMTTRACAAGSPPASAAASAISRAAISGGMGSGIRPGPRLTSSAACARWYAARGRSPASSATAAQARCSLHRVPAEVPDLRRRGGVVQRRCRRVVVGRERGRLLVPPLGLARQAAREAQLRQADREPVPAGALVRRCRGPLQRGAQLIGQLVERRPPLGPLRDQRLLECVRLGQAPAQVPGVRLGQLAAFAEAFGPVLADRLQGAVPGAVRAGDGGQQAVLGQPGEPGGGRCTGGRGPGGRPAGQQRRGRLGGEGGGEDARRGAGSPARPRSASA